MATLASAETRQAMIARLAQLGPQTVPQWGSMSAPKMLAHCTDALRMAYGDLACQPKDVPFARLAPVKWLLLNVLPWPKGSPTAKELISRVPDGWDDEKAALAALVERFATEQTRASWPVHPLFGRLSGKEWGILACKHLNHHFRQFGI